MDEKVVRYRKYTEEFKLEALELLKSSGKNSRQIERELGITAGMLLKWRDRYQVNFKDKEQFHLEPGDLEASRAEVRRLQHELAKVQEERDILKKVVNIFSRRKP